MTLDIGPTISNGRVKFASINYVESPHLLTLAEDLLSTIHAAGISPEEAEALLEELPRLLNINSTIAPRKQSA